jgi:hypothetical protein
MGAIIAGIALIFAWALWEFVRYLENGNDDEQQPPKYL